MYRAKRFAGVVFGRRLISRGQLPRFRSTPFNLTKQALNTAAEQPAAERPSGEPSEEPSEEPSGKTAAEEEASGEPSRMTAAEGASGTQAVSRKTPQEVPY